MNDRSRGKKVLSWLRRSKNASAPDEDAASDIDSVSQSIGSPPPLTEASSSTASSVVVTPPPIHRPVPLRPVPHGKILVDGVRRSQTPAGRISDTPTANRVRTPHAPQMGPVPLPLSPMPPPAFRRPRQPAVSLPSNTPLPVVHVSSAVIHKPKPLVPRPNVKIHDILSFPLPSQQPIIFDLILPSWCAKQYPVMPQPSAIAQSRAINPYERKIPYFDLPPIAQAALHEVATKPAVPRLKILVEQHSWEIIVTGYPSRENPRGYVRVQDVLSAIHNYLRTPISREEYDRTPDNFRSHVKKAYFRRCEVWSKKMHCDKDQEEKKGLRRVDFLLDMTKFQGLQRKEDPVAPDSEDRNIPMWVLKLEPYS